MDAIATRRRGLTAAGRIPTYAMSAVTRAQVEGKGDELVCILVDTKSERSLGASGLDLTGDEIVQIISALMHADATYDLLAQMPPIHPTSPSSIPRFLGTWRPLGSADHEAGHALVGMLTRQPTRGASPGP